MSTTTLPPHRLPIKINVTTEFADVIDEIAELHERAYSTATKQVRVSRGDVAESFLGFAVAMFLKKIGGLPKTEAAKKRAIATIRKQTKKAKNLGAKKKR